MHKRKSILVLSVAFILASPLSGASNIGGNAHAQEANAPAPREYKAKSPKLNRVLLDALLAKPDEILVIDVRRPDEVTKIGGLPVYLSIQAKDLERSLAFIPKDRVIVTVSNHAGRAGVAADLLASRGFKVAGAAGVQDYEAEGGTLTKIVPPPPPPTASREAATP
jgi:rhodanese-related sulfurtransferase